MVQIVVALAGMLGLITTVVAIWYAVGWFVLIAFRFVPLTGWRRHR
jgi:hypothetical protein